MQYLLQRNEKDALRKRFRNNVLFKALKAPCEEIEASAQGFKLSVEEVFYECIIALDDICEYPSEAVFSYQDFWNDRYNDYKELNTYQSDDGVADAASEVVLCVALCLNASNTPLHNTLTLSFMRQLSEHCAKQFLFREKFMANIYRLGEDKFKAGINEYLKGQDFISDEIEELLDSIPHVEINEPKDNTKGEKLTLRQLLILLDVFLNVGFTTETTNVSAYSRLVAMISGGNAGSIKTAMNRMNNINYDSREICEDVKFLASLLEPVKVELANKMREQIMVLQDLV